MSLLFSRRVSPVTNLCMASAVALYNFCVFRLPLFIISFVHLFVCFLSILRCVFIRMLLLLFTLTHSTEQHSIELWLCSVAALFCLFRMQSADVNSHKNGMAGSALLDSYSTERWASTLIGLKSSIYWKYTESARERARASQPHISSNQR